MASSAEYYGRVGLSEVGKQCVISHGGRQSRSLGTTLRNAAHTLCSLRETSYQTYPSTICFYQSIVRAFQF